MIVKPQTFIRWPGKYSSALGRKAKRESQGCGHISNGTARSMLNVNFFFARSLRSVFLAVLFLRKSDRRHQSRQSINTRDIKCENRHCLPTMERAANLHREVAEVSCEIHLDSTPSKEIL